MTTEAMRKGLQRCHYRFIENLTFENVKKLASFLFSEEIFSMEEKAMVLETRADAADRMLETLGRKYRDTNFQTLY